MPVAERASVHFRYTQRISIAQGSAREATECSWDIGTPTTEDRSDLDAARDCQIPATSETGRAHFYYAARLDLDRLPARQQTKLSAAEGNNRVARKSELGSDQGEFQHGAILGI